MRTSQYRYRFGMQHGDRRAAVLLQFIRTYLAKSGGVSPSFREMQAGAGVKSNGHVSRLIRRLEADGKIRCLHGRARALEIIDTVTYFAVERIDGEAVLIPMRGVQGIVANAASAAQSPRPSRKTSRDGGVTISNATGQRNAAVNP